MAIVTVSRERGSLGSEIAGALCRRLGFARLDKESLEALLGPLGMSAEQFEQADERRPGFWQQLTRDRVRYVDFMRAAMLRFAEAQDCVIVGRGANLIFRGVPGALRTRIVAPRAVRLARVRERFGVDEPHALRIIQQSDHDRAGYHRYFFNASWDSPEDYDVVLGTGHISTAAAVDMLVGLLRSPSFAGAGALCRAVLRDLRIAQDVVMAIAYTERVPVTQLDAVCDKGVVALDGTASSPAIAERCVEVARAVPGVTHVVSTVAVVAYPAYPGI
jgi:cytidylate kinase